jgi:thioredoxin 1
MENKFIHPETVEEFEKALAENKNVMVMFSTSWCPPCKVVYPKLSKITKDYPKVSFVKVDSEEIEELADLYEIKSLPTFMFFRNGIQRKSVPRIEGARYEDIITSIEKF